MDTYLNIDLKLIPNTYLRGVTLSKRKRGLLKKAIEIAVLCDLNICLLIQDKSKNKVIHFQSNPKMNLLDFFNTPQSR